MDIIYSKQLHITLATITTNNYKGYTYLSFKFLQTLVKTGAWGVRTLHRRAIHGAASVSSRALQIGNLYVYLWGLTQKDFRVYTNSTFIINLYKFYTQSARYVCLYF
jgi:hypothetical protein